MSKVPAAALELDGALALELAEPEEPVAAVEGFEEVVPETGTAAEAEGAAGPPGPAEPGAEGEAEAEALPPSAGGAGALGTPPGAGVPPGAAGEVSWAETARAMKSRETTEEREENFIMIVANQVGDGRERTCRCGICLAKEEVYIDAQALALTYADGCVVSDPYDGSRCDVAIWNFWALLHFHETPVEKLASMAT